MNRFPGDQRDWTKQYAAIGQFVVEYEWICWHLRFHASVLLQVKGLKHWGLSEVIFNQRVFTGEPLFSCYASMLAECLAPGHSLHQDLEAFRKEFQSLCKTRNDLLHASYLMGNDVVVVTDQETPPEAHVEKRTPDKHGARVNILATSTAELEGFVAIAITAKRNVKELTRKALVELHHDA